MCYVPHPQGAARAMPRHFEVKQLLDGIMINAGSQGDLVAFICRLG